MFDLFHKIKNWINSTINYRIQTLRLNTNFTNPADTFCNVNLIISI